MGEVDQAQDRKQEPWRWYIAGAGVMAAGVIFGFGLYLANDRSMLVWVVSALTWVLATTVLFWFARRSNLFRTSERP
jgi:hypothetical protein